MNTKTKQLAALISLALERKTFVPVHVAELLAAVKEIEDTLETISFADSNASGIKEYLYGALHTVANLLFILQNRQLANLSGNHRCLVTRAETIYGKIIKTLKGYCYVSEEHQHSLLPVKALLKKLAAISSHLEQDEAVYGLYSLLHPEITAIQQIKILPFHRWVWWSKCHAAIANAGIVNSTVLENILLSLNCNIPGFVNWLIVKLEQKMEAEISVAQKLEYLAAQLLKYELMQCPAEGYMPGERSVKHTMIAVLQRKLLLCRSLQGAGRAAPKWQYAKVNTALSVPQLALLIRLMVDTNIINENNSTALLKNIAALVSTAKTASISSESLRVNYYTPATPAKNIIKEYLLQMLRLINKY